MASPETVMFALQLCMRHSRSLSPVCSPRHVASCRSRSLGQKPVPIGTKQTFDEAFFDDDDDWIFHSALYPYIEMSPSTSASSTGPSLPPGGVMVGGAPPEPLLDFEMRPVGPQRKGHDVLHKQRYQAHIQQHCKINPTDDLGQEVTEALQQAIHRQIKADSSLTPQSTVHFMMQSDAFTHAFQSTTFPVSEFEEGSGCLDTYLQALANKRNSN